MKKIFLTVDWDFFLSANSFTRLNIYPQNLNERNREEIYEAWKNVYDNHPEILNMGIDMDKYTAFTHIILKYSHLKLFRSFFVSDSHKFMYEIVLNELHSKNLSNNTSFALFNIDYHHDKFDYYQANEEINCGNWVNKLQEKCPNMSYTWFCKKDSEKRTIWGQLKDTTIIEEECFEQNLSHIFEQGKIDAVLLCRSGVWSPPHLDRYFNRLISVIESSRIKRRVTDDFYDRM